MKFNASFNEHQCQMPVVYWMANQPKENIIDIRILAKRLAFRFFFDICEGDCGYYSLRIVGRHPILFIWGSSSLIHSINSAEQACRSLKTVSAGDELE